MSPAADECAASGVYFLTHFDRLGSLRERGDLMKTQRLNLVMFVLGLVGISVGGVACSDGAADDPSGAGGASVTGAGGTVSTGGQPATGGAAGGSSTGNGGAPATTGAGGSAGSATGGMATGGAAAGAGGPGGAAGMATGSGGAGRGGSATGGTSAGGAGGMATGGSGPGGAGRGGSATGGTAAGGTGGQVSGSCVASKSTGRTVSGTGPHKVVVETNSANGIKCGTIYRPEDLGGTEKYPIFVWGEGGCSQDGYSNQAAMAEIASWGYFIVADGTPGGTNACGGGQDGKAFLDYLTWAIAENGKSCSAYYQSLETTKIAADGFSCGGLMSENASGDPRFSAIGITSSGLMSVNATLYNKIHTPFKIMNGGSSDIAYENGLRDYDQISSRGIPILYFSKTSAGHGGDLGQARGDFNKVNLAWLNWQLKGDTGATGKGYLYGSTCSICTNSGWVVKSANVQ
jgi:hypothetical protein